MYTWLVAFVSVATYEFYRKDFRKISKKFRRKYEDWLDS